MCWRVGFQLCPILLVQVRGGAEGVKGVRYSGGLLEAPEQWRTAAAHGVACVT